MRYFYLETNANCGILPFMSTTLQQMVDRYLLANGKNAEAKLAMKADLSVSTVRNARRRGYISDRNVVKLALACGLTEEEALTLARECSSNKAAKTA